jgi:hypothetical protein
MNEIFKYELIHSKDFSITVGSLALSAVIILVNVFVIKLISKVIQKRLNKNKTYDGR